MHTQPKRLEYDVCIVGSGAGGGIAAHVLTKAGANVVMLEAGGWWDNTRDSKMLTWPWMTPRRGASTTERPFGEYDACIGGWEIDGEPYTKADGTKFDWWRARMLARSAATRPTFRPPSRSRPTPCGTRNCRTGTSCPACLADRGSIARSR